MALKVKFLSKPKEKNSILSGFAKLRSDYMEEYPNLNLNDFENCFENTKQMFDMDIVVVAIFDDNKLIGGNITGEYEKTPIGQWNPHKKFFLKTNQDLEDFTHTTFVLVDRDYRKQGVGKMIFDNVDILTKKLNRKGVLLDSVIRHPNDPRRPENWRDSSEFFSHIGYQKINYSLVTATTLDVGDEFPKTKYYQSWVKYV